MLFFGSHIISGLYERKLPVTPKSTDSQLQYRTKVCPRCSGAGQRIDITMFPTTTKCPLCGGRRRIIYWLRLSLKPPHATVNMRWLFHETTLPNAARRISHHHLHAVLGRKCHILTKNHKKLLHDYSSRDIFLPDIAKIAFTLATAL